MDLISIIIIAVIIKKVLGKLQEEQNRIKKNTSPQNMWDQVAGQMNAGQAQSRQYTSTYSRSSSDQNEQWKKLARENIEKAKKRASEKLREVEEILEIEDKPAGTYQMPKQNVRTTPAYEQITLQQQNRSAMQQVRAGRMEARTTSILNRAVKNADEDKVDVTLETMERQHNHSERVSSAEHHHPEDVIPENMLGNIEDLMIKGYDGTLCFERDFIGEAMDMISRFTVPTDVPDFSKNDVA